jgi:hypothetical protein
MFASMQSMTLATAKSVFFSDSPVATGCCYAAALGVSYGIYEFVGGREWTSVLSISAVAHCLGLGLLCVQVNSNGAGGISARSLMLNAIALVLRLSSTLFFHGYLPSDASGDIMFQMIDIGSLVLVMYLLRSVLYVNKDTYQEFDDDMSVGPLVFICLFLGALLHGDMDDNAIADSFWLAGLFVSVLVVLPQYWLILKSEGQVHILTAHYIAASAVDRFLSGYFMWFSRNWITCQPWVGQFEHTVNAILLAHLIHMVLLSDFGVFYIKKIIARDWTSTSTVSIPAFTTWI